MLEPIGRNFNRNASVGPALIILQGGAAFILDGMHLKNVVLQNVTVVYQGGPVILENIYFVGCTFAINQSAASRELSATLLKPSPVSFTTSNKG